MAAMSGGLSTTQTRDAFLDGSLHMRHFSASLNEKQLLQILTCFFSSPMFFASMSTSASGACSKCMASLSADFSPIPGSRHRLLISRFIDSG